MISNVFYKWIYALLKSFTTLFFNMPRSSFFVFILFKFFSNPLSSMPIQDLDNSRFYKHIQISKTIYQTQLPLEEIIQTIKIKESPTSYKLLVPKDLESNWKLRNVKYQILKYPQKFSEIDPNHNKRFQKGCIPLREMKNGYKNNQLNELYLTCIASEFPDLVSKVSIGRSVQKRNIPALVIKIPKEKTIENDNFNLNMYRDKIFINCSIHANEIISTEHCYDTIQTLILFEYKNPILQNLEIWIVPILNPDGSEYYWNQDTNLGRKNGNKVDLNRNFPFKWNSGSTKASSSNPESAFYRGKHQASEPEVKAVLNLFQKHRFLFSISYHCYANAILVPYSIEKTQNPEPNLVSNIANEMIQSVYSYRQDKPFLAKKNLYEVDGTDQDTFFHDFGTYAYLIESSHRVENYKNLPVILDGFRPIIQNLLFIAKDSWKIRLKIQNSKGIPIVAKIANSAFTYYEDEKFESNMDGFYHLLVPNANKVKIQISATGYEDKTIELSPNKEFAQPFIVEMNPPTFP